MVLEFNKDAGPTKPLRTIKNRDEQSFELDTFFLEVLSTLRWRHGVAIRATSKSRPRRKPPNAAVSFRGSRELFYCIRSSLRKDLVRRGSRSGS